MTYTRAGRKARRINRLLVLICALVALIMLLPILWGLLTSFKTRTEIYRYPPTFWPENFSLQGYRNVLQSNVPLQMFNSVKISLMTIIGTVFVSVLAGFSFARADFKGKNVLLFILIGTQMIPGLSNVITLYIMGNRMGLLNTHFYVALIYTASQTPTCIWLMKSYFEQIPPALEEAAMVDGCSRAKSLLLVVAPLVSTGIAACSMLVFVSAWNEFLVSMTMISRTKLKTYPVGLYAFILENDTNWVNLSAATILGLLPVLLLFLSFQKSFIAGMTSGAVKA